MDYLSEHNSIVWLIFIVYAITTLLIVPDLVGDHQSPKSAAEHNERALSFASRFLTRIGLIVPLLLLLGNSI